MDSFEFAATSTGTVFPSGLITSSLGTATVVYGSMKFIVSVRLSRRPFSVSTLTNVSSWHSPVPSA